MDRPRTNPFEGSPNLVGATRLWARTCYLFYQLQTEKITVFSIRTNKGISERYKSTCKIKLFQAVKKIGRMAATIAERFVRG